MSTSDDRLTLAGLGGVAYVTAMVLHEVVGHGLGCALAGEHPLLTSVATQCSVQPWAVVLAGPLLNVAAGCAMAFRRRGDSATRPPRWMAIWLLMAYNLLLASGYLLFCGLAGFGDWAMLASPWLNPFVWRAIAVAAGAYGYYSSLRGLAGQMSRLRPLPDTSRLRGLVWWPYLGAGIVAVAAGALNPIDLTRRVFLPVASSFGAGYGLTRVPHLLTAEPHGEGSMLGTIDRRPAWLAMIAVMVLLFVGLLGPGFRLGS